MTMRNTVTYTQYSETYRAHMEQHVTLYRARKLTCAGAQRILRRDEGRKDAIVTRVEAIAQV